MDKKPEQKSSGSGIEISLFIFFIMKQKHKDNR